jgi:RsiW-degrading membrane proteinase PrsW (M82 family)
MDPIITLYALFGPFLVWPIEHFLPYPYIVEELFKVFVVLAGGSKNAKAYAIAGVAFALTETVLYTINVNTTGSIGYMFTRFASSSILHTITFLIIFYFANKNKKLTIIGFLLAALVHYFYNSYISLL